MIQTIHMVCGVPGSGKSWVCEQLTQQFTYVKHDDHIRKGPLATSATNALVSAVIAAATKGKPVLVDCPFAERELRSKLEAVGLTVVPYFIIEPTEIVKSRYERREGRPLPQPSVTRSVTIQERAHEWRAIWGSSEVILARLRAVVL